MSEIIDEIEFDEDEATKFELELATINHHRKNAADNAIEAFVAELEKECIDERGKGDDMDKMIYLGKIRETAKRMKGEV